MKKLLVLITVIFAIANLLLLSGCDDDKCEACHGTGYYNAVNCPMCDGTGHSDFDMSDIPVY